MNHTNFCAKIIILILLLCCTSCISENLQKIVDEWQGKLIIFPDNMTDFLTGDTIDFAHSDFTIVSYVDSTGCTGCKMKLALWKEYMDSLNLRTDMNINFVIIVNTVDSLALKRLLNMYAFNNYVFLDFNDNVNSVNKFPKESSCQTFLLDRNRKVLAIGNPVLSSKIGHLYNSIILGRISVSSTNKIIISVPINTIDLGNLGRMQSVKKPIKFFNEGNSDIKISKVISSCDCVDLELPSRSIPLSSNLEASLLFLGDTASGDFERTIHVYYEGMDYPTVLNVIGHIE